MIIKTTRLVPKGFGAITVWPFIFVLPKKAGHTGLIEHELVHYREQAWIAPIWWLRYLLSKSFRLAAEVRAYKRQIEVSEIGVTQAALWLTKYKTGVTYQQAFELLTKK